MLFKDVKQNYNLYVLNTKEVSVKIGKVLSAGYPRLENPSSNITNAKMVIDFNVEIDGKTASYVIPENLTVTYTDDLIISPDKDIILHEIEAMKTQAERAIAAVDRQKVIINKTTELLTELNPQFRERRETEERFGNMERRFGKIEESVDDLKSMFGDFLKKFNNERGYRNEK